MISPGLIFALLTTLSWSICIFPFTQAARRLGSNSLNNFRLLLATIIIGIAALFINQVGFTELFTDKYTNAWIWLGLSGIIGLTIGDYFAFVMYKILGARIGSVLTTFAPAAALILGSVLIQERISAIGIAGIALTIAGVNYVSLGKNERVKIPDHGYGSIAFGIFAGILSALCQGAGLVLAKKGLIAQTSVVEISPLNATFIRLSVAAFSLLFFTIVSGNVIKVFTPIFTNQNKGVKFAISGTLFGPTLGVTLSLFTVSYIDPSVAQTIFSLVPAFAIFLSAIFLKDKISLQSVIGVAVAISGVMILIWRDAIQEFF